MISDWFRIATDGGALTYSEQGPTMLIMKYDWKKLVLQYTTTEAVQRSGHYTICKEQPLENNFIIICTEKYVLASREDLAGPDRLSLIKRATFWGGI